MASVSHPTSHKGVPLFKSTKAKIIAGLIAVVVGVSTGMGCTTPTLTPGPTPTATPTAEEIRLSEVGTTAAGVLEEIDVVSGWITEQVNCDTYLSNVFWDFYQSLTQATQKGNLHLDAGLESLEIAVTHRETGRLEKAIEEGEVAIERLNQARINFWWVHDKMAGQCDLRGLENSPQPAWWN